MSIIIFEEKDLTNLRVYKVDFDAGKITYFDDYNLIQVYHFHSFYDVCKMVFACHLPFEEMLRNVIVKEKAVPILECYIEQIMNTFLNTEGFTENDSLEFSGSVFSYPVICNAVYKIVQNSELNCKIYVTSTES